MCRRLGFHPAAKREGQQRGERIVQFLRSDLSDLALVGKQRREPFVGSRCQCRVGQVRPLLAFRPAQKQHAITPLFACLRPW
jgi:hypothetical protein